MSRPRKPERHPTQHDHPGRVGRKQLIAWIEEEHHEALSKLAAETNTTIQSLVQKAVRSLLLDRMRIEAKEFETPKVARRTLVLLYAGDGRFVEDVHDLIAKAAIYDLVKGRQSWSLPKNKLARPQIRFFNPKDHAVQKLARDRWVYTNWKFRWVEGDEVDLDTIMD